MTRNERRGILGFDYHKYKFEKTKPVNFFYKLPKNIREKYELLYYKHLGPESFLWINDNKEFGDLLMKNISLEKYKKIVNSSPYESLIIFSDYYKLLQPVIKEIVEQNNLYEQYPEYVI